MSNLFEDYYEIDDMRDKLDAIIELVHSAPRRVFLTKQGKVKAIVIGPEDYEDLWNIELDRDMALAREESARGEVYTHEEVMAQMRELEARLRSQ